MSKNVVQKPFYISPTLKSGSFKTDKVYSINGRVHQLFSGVVPDCVTEELGSNVIRIRFRFVHQDLRPVYRDLCICRDWRDVVNHRGEDGALV